MEMGLEEFKPRLELGGLELRTEKALRELTKDWDESIAGCEFELEVEPGELEVRLGFVLELGELELELESAGNIGRGDEVVVLADGKGIGGGKLKLVELDRLEFGELEARGMGGSK
jgi:hypothetical protein